MTLKKYMTTLNKLANYKRNLIIKVMKRANNNYTDKICINLCKI